MVGSCSNSTRPTEACFSLGFAGRAQSRVERTALLRKHLRRRARPDNGCSRIGRPNAIPAVPDAKAFVKVTGIGTYARFGAERGPFRGRPAAAGPAANVVLGLLCVVGVEQASAPEPAQHSQLDRVSYRFEVGAVGDRELVKGDTRSLGLATEDAIRHSNTLVS
jgi:hypothetical protein